MLNLYVARHGETEWNVQNRMQGRLDSKLTAQGIYHAGLLGRKLASTEFESVISSPSTRAVHTAEFLMGDRPLPFETDERLMEIHLGSWQGKTIDQIKAMDPYNYECYLHLPNKYWRDDGAENFQDVITRLESILKSLEETYQSGNLLIVTHGVVVKILQMICKNNSLTKLWIPPVIDGTSLSIVKMEDGKKELILEGDVSHKTVII
ncbi:histidine phosphatase family protein [Virgibacillus profundi]|uniref:Histidine phosphatase family protein n=1 Tax=Virgibacillus profundi TaxID=2024555 RepID=A0A2A2I8T5_9BACI|nr:histidine phosphatase family protein [Virgibacillus profundi]PAV27982.1 histidine phosphatase family protein [Virgibacillus profundi]PXY52160.1 histidine phosphatase family protein [Virgibacillus profundi]